MAEQAVQVDQETFSCSICLDLLKDPVTIPCGHSYCMNCIRSFWDEEDQKGIHSCPQCRKTFTPRPVLEKSIILAGVVEQMKKTGLQDTPANHCYDVPEDVACDFCIGGKLKAIKSCLVCLASYCEKHLQPHYEVLSLLENHILVEPIKNLQQNILSSAEGTENPIWFDIGLYTDPYILQSEPEPKTRADFLTYCREITLDPNTAHPQLVLSSGNRKVTFTYNQQSHHSHPDRFTEWFQVLSDESLTGRCYWEVEWRGRGVSVAVAYKNISRAEGGIECGFGHNDKSWALLFEVNGNSFWYNNTKTHISGPGSSRVGVYLDHRAGLLSFYSISETMTLLHRVQTTFTQPLLAGLRMYNTALSAEFCKPR
ncbi:tripartite motif-containing protein 16-like [Girardinichthys multiradiatus]|uniref:tripartite motif-containing protein 16-like n=1 Tax=Girardinichthys multiradiatus TaxID=208333 RepID=UPI001FAC34C2|nr:tripartite motif-containing protein 16-like [Girardinichthys multiradiatus]XP_047223469.1 tripartite motif-containing protein 16-like [Girardinichthys multiradiatus]